MTAWFRRALVFALMLVVGCGRSAASSPAVEEIAVAGLHVGFEANGIAVSRSGTRWTLRVAAVGRDGHGFADAAARSHSREGARVVYRRNHGVTEWFESRDEGLEQVIAIDAPPAGAGPLVARMDTGGLTAALVERDGERVVELKRGARALLRYGRVHVEDAGGRSLGAWLSVEGDRIALAIDDAGARYPITIDPLVWAVEETQLLASDGASDKGSRYFGRSFALSGDTAIVGAVDEFRGTANVFTRLGTTWSDAGALVATDATDGDNFGYDVAIDGDTAVVGAIGVGNGAAYVFVRSGTKWTQQAKLVASDGGYSDQLGRTVDVDGDTAVVVSPFHSTFKGSVGTAYVFVRSGTTWTEQAKLLAADGSGETVTDAVVDGDTILLRIAGTTTKIVAYVRSGTTWSKQGTFAPTDVTAASCVGPMALEGDTAIVGAQCAGAAYVFGRSAGVWSQTAKLLPKDGAKTFGFPVSLSGDTVMASAVGDSAVDGATYAFVRAGSTWTEQAKLTLTGSSDYGTYVALSGDSALVGGREVKLGGSIRVLARAGSTWTTQATLTPTTPAVGDGDLFGSSVSVDADTTLVGAPGSALERGAAYVFVESGGTWSQQAKLVASDAVAGAQLGVVSVSGDTALVGAPGAECAWTFVRSGTTWTQEAKLVPTDTDKTSFGKALAIEGDTAIIAGTSAVYAFARKSGVWAQEAKLTPTDGGWPEAYRGVSVSLSGDTAVIGMNASYGFGGTIAIVFVRSGSIWSQQAKFVSPTPYAWDFAASVAVSGDTLVVAQDGMFVPSPHGVARVFVRSGSSWTKQAELVSDSPGVFGTYAALHGDDALIGGVGLGGFFVRSGTTWSKQASLAASRAVGPVALGADFAVTGAPHAESNAGVAYVFTRGHAVGDDCGDDSECASGLCVGGFCAAPPACPDAGCDATPDAAEAAVDSAIEETMPDTSEIDAAPPIVDARVLDDSGIGETSPIVEAGPDAQGDSVESEASCACRGARTPHAPSALFWSLPLALLIRASCRASSPRRRSRRSTDRTSCSTNRSTGSSSCRTARRRRTCRS